MHVGICIQSLIVLIANSMHAAYDILASDDAVNNGAEEAGDYTQADENDGGHQLQEKRKQHGRIRS